MVNRIKIEKNHPSLGQMSLKKVPASFLDKHLVFSREPGKQKRYVQDELREMEDEIAEMLVDPNTYVYVCGLRAMEEGIEAAFTSIAETLGQQWAAMRDVMREEGRYHVETY